VTMKFGQSMYTPEDYARTDLIEDDRPYAGLLYLGMAWNRRRPAQESTTEILDTRELTLGVIGPASLAHEAQDIVHDLKGVEKFRGWDNQLHNEPALQVAMERKFRTYRGTGAVIPGFSSDLIRSLGLHLGNIETAATMGIEGRVGWNMPNDFGSYPIKPGAENRPPSAAIHDDSTQSSAARPRSGIHLFSTLEAKLVGYDFSLDGNLFKSSHQVTRRPLVAQASIGISIQSLIAGHGVRLASMWVHRTREFKEQSENHSFGSVALSIEF
ncbi:MAG TPA: lipid A deacylase LpxR family protein, partial [Burkholderiaceae bacterium]|nr:lipid A deacylase LpxR family protein [Burkholderiaceae bacterium]